ncbi:hypothetical protein B296_00033486 [Ensete ventricosum]|uniref:DOG1 domain-containing protein n=1 Tax=Ensete ventricosum TaxID=4639 RepID=A0A426Z877_ENSVE|nr:hypothetical protein B296_00033486 [Ensete ventricosum]
MNIAGALAFDVEYARWLEEHNRQINELRSAVNAHASENDLRVIVDGVMAHYDEIFRLKGIAAKADVFHILSGMWKTPAERCFLWLGGFRSSELLKVQNFIRSLLGKELRTKMFDPIRSLHFEVSKEAQSSQRWEEAAFAVVQAYFCKARENWISYPAGEPAAIAAFYMTLFEALMWLQEIEYVLISEAALTLRYPMSDLLVNLEHRQFLEAGQFPNSSHTRDESAVFFQMPQPCNGSGSQVQVPEMHQVADGFGQFFKEAVSSLVLLESLARPDFDQLIFVELVTFLKYGAGGEALFRMRGGSV